MAIEQKLQPINKKSPHQLTGEHRLALLMVLAIFLVWAGGMLFALRDAALPEKASGVMLVVFPPDLSQEGILSSIVEAGGRPVRVSWPQNVWVVSGDTAGFAGRLYKSGALAAYTKFPMGPVLAGCFAYVRTDLPWDKKSR
jgi:hypothetical protein